MRKIVFTALRSEHDQSRDGEAGWSISVDGKEICEVDSDEMDISDSALNPLWEALGVELKFDYE